jgi:Holliday junction resolvasome RuvABC endonuclease subunit
MTEKTFDGGLLPGPASPVSIGIDQSLTGFAITALNINKPECYETWVYKSQYSGVHRLSDIRYWMELKFDFLDTQGCEIKEIAMEGTVLASQSALVLGELAGMVKLSIWDFFEEGNGYPEHLRRPLQIPPMTLKKYATGKGTAKKQEMLMQMYKRWGVEFNDDNAADSYALARLAAGSVTGAVEAQVVEQIKDPKYRDSK